MRPYLFFVSGVAGWADDGRRMRLLMEFQPAYATALTDLLADTAQQGIDYLLVATHPKDDLYHWLRPYAIDRTNYSLFADFAVRPTDQLVLDVRCL